MPTAIFRRWSRKCLLFAGMLLVAGIATAASIPSATPILTFSPLTPTTLTLSDHDTTVVRYQVTNQSTRTHTFAMRPIPGVTMLAGSGDCAAPFTLPYRGSCVLDLQLVGSAMSGDITSGPVVCVDGNLTLCYQPSSVAQLHVTLVHEATASIEVEPASLSMPVGGTATITVTNMDASLAAQNLRIDVPAESGIEVASTTCSASLPPGSNCTFDITGSAPETTTLAIMGDNTTTASVVVTVSDDVIFTDGFEERPADDADRHAPLAP